MLFLTLDGKQCGYRRPQGSGGTGGCLVLVHGSGADSSVWEYQAAQLSDRFDLIMPDLPGHGGSAGVKSTARDYADWLHRFSAALEIRSFFLAGHSLGGAIAQEYARAHAQTLKGVVLVGTGTRLKVAQDYLLLLDREFEAAARISCTRAYGPSAAAPLAERGYAMLIENGRDTLRGDLEACARFDSSGWVSSIKMPVLVVCGEQDAIAHPEGSRTLSRAIPGSTLQVIPGAGHMVMQEAPAAFNNALLNFMQNS